MFLKFIRTVTILISFIFLTGFLPLFAFLGPSLTVATSGSVYKASAQLIINKTIKDSTGKNSLTFVREKIENIEKIDNSNYINQELKKIVQRRIEVARKKLNLKNINQ